jgi:hypothetical protein
MKTSNKILIALIVFVFGAYATINAMLYSKIGKGDFVTREQYESESRQVIKTEAFNTIELVNCAGVSLHQSDSFYLSVDKSREKQFNYKVEGNKLIITMLDADEKKYVPMRVMAKSVSSIILNNSDIYLDDFKSESLEVSATKNSFFEMLRGKVDALKLSAQNSTRFELTDETTIGTIELSLAGVSEFNPNNARISRIKASYISDSAKLELPGRSFKAFADSTNNK